MRQSGWTAVLMLVLAVFGCRSHQERWLAEREREAKVAEAVRNSRRAKELESQGKILAIITSRCPEPVIVWLRDALGVRHELVVVQPGHCRQEELLAAEFDRLDYSSQDGGTVHHRCYEEHSGGYYITVYQ